MSDAGSSSGQRDCVLLLGKKLYTRAPVFTQVLKWLLANLMLGDNLAMD